MEMKRIKVDRGCENEIIMAKKLELWANLLTYQGFLAFQIVPPLGDLELLRTGTTFTKTDDRFEICDS